MAHYAFLDKNNIVIEVIVGIDENELIDGMNPELWYSIFKQKKCLRTSYNNNIRKQFAGIGFYYDEENDVFIAPKPYDSWVLDENFDWQAPISKPENGFYFWNEESKSWITRD